MTKNKKLFQNNIRSKKKILCSALSILLATGNCTGSVVLAAQDTTQPSQTQAAQPQPETAPAPGSQPAQPPAPEQTTPESTDAQPVKLSEEELAAYYRDSVFIGDSIMLGFRNYSAKQKTFVHGIQFLAVGSYSAFNALKPVAGDNVHPLYKGKKVQVWNAIPLMGSKRAFILLGMNDIAPLGLEGARDKYKELIDKIVETSPDIEIHIISMTYTLRDQGKNRLNNKNIAQYNTLLQEMADENGWGYIDLCTPLSDGSGNLAGKYCSDGFVHLSKSAYAVWESELIDYANEQAAESKAETESQTETELQTETKLQTETELQTESQTEPQTEPAADTTGTAADAATEPAADAVAAP